jgi:hypothetical protein
MIDLKKYHSLKLVLFDTNFRISSTETEVVDFFEILFPDARRIDIESQLSDDFFDFRVTRVNDNEYFIISFDDKKVYIDGKPYLITQSYLNFMAFFPAKVTQYFLFHSATIKNKDKGFILAGPPGFGKSTLAYSLKLSGSELLSDELAAIYNQNGLIYPYNKLTTLRENSLRFFDKTSLEIKYEMLLLDDSKKYLVSTSKTNEQIQCYKNGLKPDFIFLLSNKNIKENSEKHLYYLIVDKMSDLLLEKIKSSEDIIFHKIEQQKKFPIVYFKTNDFVKSMKLIKNYCSELKIQIFCLDKFEHTKQDFSNDPTIVPLDNNKGIMEVCEYLKGGIESGIAQKTYLSNIFEIFFRLKDIFQDTRFFLLYPGNLEKTKKLVIDTVSI